MRVLSYNIHKGIGGQDRRYRLERIIQVIEAEDPDLICLQEVDRHVRRSKFHDQPTMLAGHFAAVAHTYQLNVHLRTGGYGNLLLSRWPFQAQHQVSLTMRRKKPRGAQLAVVETPQGPLHLVNWHLGLAEGERQWQVRRLLEHHVFRDSNELPTLIIGDYNDWRNTLENGPFAVHRFSQATAPLTLYRSFPAYLPVGALDKAFVRGGVVVDSARIGNQHPEAKWASDHLPLVLDFHLEQEGGQRGFPVNGTQPPSGT